MAIMPQLQVTQGMVADRVIEQLGYLRNDYGGFPVDRLEHSLQPATRAERDGRDDEYLVCALLHDIGDTLAPFNHPTIAAGILEPFVSKANHWMVRSEEHTSELQSLTNLVCRLLLEKKKKKKKTATKRRQHDSCPTHRQ